MLLPSTPISTPDDTLPVDREGGGRDEIDMEGLDDYEDEEEVSLTLTLPTDLLISIYLPYLATQPSTYPTYPCP